MSKLISFIIILLFGVYTFILSVTNGLGFYIHPRYYEFSQFGTYVCLFVGTAGIIYALKTFKFSKAKKELFNIKTYIPFTIFFIILVIGFALPPTTLSSRAASNRSSGDTLVGSRDSLNESIFDVFTKTDTSFTISDWVKEFAVNRNLPSYEGRNVDVTGFIYRDDSLLENEFVVGRFVIRCCIVDATPVGVTVLADDFANYKDDEWVRLQGEFIIEERDGAEVLRIIPSDITIVEQPDSPYIY